MALRRISDEWQLRETPAGPDAFCPRRARLSSIVNGSLGPLRRLYLRLVSRSPGPFNVEGHLPANGGEWQVLAVYARRDRAYDAAKRAAHNGDFDHVHVLPHDSRRPCGSWNIQHTDRGRRVESIVAQSTTVKSLDEPEPCARHEPSRR